MLGGDGSDEEGTDAMPTARRSNFVRTRDGRSTYTRCSLTHVPLTSCDGEFPLASSTRDIGHANLIAHFRLFCPTVQLSEAHEGAVSALSGIARCALY